MSKKEVLLYVNNILIGLQTCEEITINEKRNTISFILYNEVILTCDYRTKSISVEYPLNNVIVLLKQFGSFVNPNTGFIRIIN